MAPASHVHGLPDSIESQAAPLIQVLTTVLHAQRRAAVGTGVSGGSDAAAQSVAVLGLGVSGQLHLQLAKARGSTTVIGVSRSRWKRSLAEQLGADATASAGQDAIASVKAATGGHGADVVIESTGVVTSIADALAMVRPGGTIVLFGIYTASEGALPFYQLYYKEPVVISARAAMPEDFPESIALVASGRVRLSTLVTHVLPVSELRQALGMLERDDDSRMKIILEN
jgi:L-iditol 2-dehydrogenase